MTENIHKSICQSSADDKDLTLSSVFVWSSSSLPVDQVVLEAAHFYFNIKQQDQILKVFIRELFEVKWSSRRNIHSISQLEYKLYHL